jgi:hypothetical protein
LRRRDAALLPAQVEIGFQGARCRLRVPAKWLNLHPLTREDLLQEKHLLSAIGVELTVSGKT